MDRAEAAASRASAGEERAASSSGERGKFLWVSIVALAIVLLDQVTKLWVAASMRLHESIPVIPDFFSLTYVRNTGAAFSMFAGHDASYRVPFFIVVSLIAAGVIVSLIRSTPSSQKLALLGCALVLGGAVGNLIDRIAYGEVIDFLDVYWGDWHWPAFNVADSAITSGVVLLLFRGVFFGQREG